MAESHDRSPQRFGSTLSIAGLFLFTALLSVVIYETSGEWPTELGGLGALGFGVVSVALALYSVITGNTNWTD